MIIATPSRHEVSSRTSELETIEARIREMEERLREQKPDSEQQKTGHPSPPSSKDGDQPSKDEQDQSAPKMPPTPSASEGALRYLLVIPADKLYIPFITSYIPGTNRTDGENRRSGRIDPCGCLIFIFLFFFLPFPSVAADSRPAQAGAHLHIQALFSRIVSIFLFAAGWTSC